MGAPASLGGLWGHWDYTGVLPTARVLQTNPWTTPNYDLGFPWAQDLAHSPTPDVLHLLVLKVIVWVVQDPIVALNVFLILGFGFVAIAMYALLRVLRVTPGISFALAVSFSLLPWHFDRLIHAFLSNYSSVPVGLVLLIAVLSWPLALSGPERGRPRDQIIALGLAVYVGLSGGYYAVFISILALTTLTFQILAGRRGRSLIPAVWLGILPVAIVAGRVDWATDFWRSPTHPRTRRSLASPRNPSRSAGRSSRSCARRGSGPRPCLSLA